MKDKNQPVTLKQIEKLMDKKFNIQENKFDKKLDNHRDKLIKYMDVRFDELRDQIRDIKTELEMINGKLNVLESKINSIKKLETEDIEVAYDDIAEIKERLFFVENKLAMVKH